MNKDLTTWVANAAPDSIIGKLRDERRVMTNQVIPAEAVEAAHKAWREQAALDGSIFEYNLRAALEAAAPYIAAGQRAAK